MKRTPNNKKEPLKRDPPSVKDNSVRRILMMMFNVIIRKKWVRRYYYLLERRTHVPTAYPFSKIKMERTQMSPKRLVKRLQYELNEYLNNLRKGKTIMTEEDRLAICQIGRILEQANTYSLEWNEDGGRPHSPDISFEEN